MKFYAQISGSVPSKSNCYGVGKIGNRCSMYKTKKLKDYEKLFGYQIQEFKHKSKIELPVDSEFMATILVTYENKRSDLDNSLKIILDCLQSFGVIKNDNLCYRLEVHKRIDKNNPMVEIEIERI